jgi:ketosteroid isomerase-like protein
MLILAAIAPAALRADGPPPATPAPPAASTPAPEAVVDAFHRALAAGDREGALALLAPDVVIFESGGAELSRDEYASHHLAADMEFSAAVKTKLRDRRQGSDGDAADAAWVMSRTETEGSFRGRAIDSLGTETMVLRKTPEGWRIVHVHWSSQAAGGD